MVEAATNTRRLRGWTVAAITVLAAIPVLAASFASKDAGGLAVSGWALLLALVWAAGGLFLLRGVPPIRSGHERMTFAAAVGWTLATGTVLALGSLVGGLALSSLPVTAPLVAGPVEAVASQPLAILFGVALIAGAAEEVFFRLALPTLLTGVRQWVVPTALYAIVTLFSGTVALALMAIILGLVAMWVLRRTGRWWAPIAVHALWTVAMVVVFPLLVR